MQYDNLYDVYKDIFDLDLKLESKTANELVRLFNEPYEWKNFIETRKKENVSDKTIGLDLAMLGGFAARNLNMDADALKKIIKKAQKLNDDIKKEKTFEQPSLF